MWIATDIVWKIKTSYLIFEMFKLCLWTQIGYIAHLTCLGKQKGQ